MKLHLLALSLFFAACNTGRSPQTTTVTDSTGAAATSQAMVFGRFCGMCPSNCATMYLVDESRQALFIDTTDSYRTDNGLNLNFPEGAVPAAHYQLARRAMAWVPDSLRLAKDGERFGCPDCADGCGIFVRLQTPEGRKHFYLDYQTENLSGYIRPFADSLKGLIQQLEGRR